MEELFLLLACFACIFLGNCGGDQATLRNCATTGQAKMVGGGTLICEVKKGGAK